MSNPIPSQISLATITNGTLADGSVVQSNDTAIQTALNQVIAALSNGTSGQALEAVDSSHVQWATLPVSPGTELAYAQITAPVAVTGTSSGSPTSIVGTGAVTYDGNPVMVEFFSPQVSPPTASSTNLTILALYEGGTLICILDEVVNESNSSQRSAHGRLRFTPSAGSHTYAIQSWVTNTTGAPAVSAGSGSGGTLAPAFLRITKV